MHRISYGLSLKKQTIFSMYGNKSRLHIMSKLGTMKITNTLFVRALAAPRCLRNCSGERSVTNARPYSLSAMTSTLRHPSHLQIECSRRCFTSKEQFVSGKIPSDMIATDTSSSNDHITIPGSQTGGRKLAIVFTCNVCETRSAKQFTERSYTHGVVIVRCPGCDNLHLIADRLQYFGADNFDLNTIVERTGRSYKTVDDQNVYELSLEELVGKERTEELLRDAVATSTERAP